jgi:hypothetical protein
MKIEEITALYRYRYRYRYIMWARVARDREIEREREREGACGLNQSSQFHLTFTVSLIYVHHRRLTTLVHPALT